MGLGDQFKARLEDLKRWSPQEVRRLTRQRLEKLIDTESVRAHRRVMELKERFPSAQPRELCQHLIEQKKQLAGMVGGITGVFGLITVPVDLGGMVYLQLSLLIEIAQVFKVNPRHERARAELLDLFAESNGIGPLQRSTPRVVGSLSAALLARGGLNTLSRAMPMVAAPVSAYLNAQHIQRVGEAAIRHYDGWQKVAKGGSAR